MDTRRELLVARRGLLLPTRIRRRLGEVGKRIAWGTRLSQSGGTMRKQQEPQQTTLSIRIPQALRETLQRLRAALANGRNQRV